MAGTSHFFISVLCLHCRNKFAGVNEPHTTTATPSLSQHTNSSTAFALALHYQVQNCRCRHNFWPFMFHSAVAPCSRHLHSYHSIRLHTFICYLLDSWNAIHFCMIYSTMKAECMQFVFHIVVCCLTQIQPMLTLYHQFVWEKGAHFSEKALKKNNCM